MLLSRCRSGRTSWTAQRRLRTVAELLALTMVLSLVTPTDVGASLGTGGMQSGDASADPVQAVVAAARSHIGARYAYGGTGPRFDCSGLVYRVFKETGQLAKIGGRRRTAAGLLRWFQRHGLVSAKGGQPGDLVIYNGGSHVGIYIGNGKVISAVLRGVRMHGLHRMTIPFTAFLHTRLGAQPGTPAQHASLAGTDPVRLPQEIVGIPFP